MARLNHWLWQHWATECPQAIALYHEDEAMTWAELDERIESLAHGFQQQGVAPGSGVALRGKNSFPLLLAYLAALRCGARVLPLNPQLPDTLLADLLPKINITFFWSEDRSSSFDCVALKHIGASKTDHAMPVWDGARPATLTLTSASTGLPKAVAHHLNAHLENAKGVLAVMHYAKTDCWLLSLPLFHVSGQGIVWRWLAQGTIIAVRASRSLAHALRGCTHASLVPTQLIRLLDESLDDLRLKEVLLGGAMIPAPLVRRAREANIICWCGYGLTEMASTVCAKRADESSSVGSPLPGREIKIVEEEILLRGAGMALGYWRDDGIQPITDSDGWLHTRDRGIFERGELRILGRLDNLFFSGGEGIQPEDIERVLLRHPDISQAFIVPIADHEFGHRPVAVLEKDESVSLDAIRAWLRDKVARFQQPVTYYTLPEKLKTGAIKISRAAVQQWVENQQD
ncbi:MAG: o-succinylbenzoate--CoA ligase [Burkholderiales bacterium]|jgi:O-succinylbenzoic acid--CoA ligase|nr:o-succinylbenzoate--CoA ligase [Burkholderiales bacterium]